MVMLVDDDGELLLASDCLSVNILLLASIPIVGESQQSDVVRQTT